MNAAQLINQTSGRVEWYTPTLIVEAARRVMGAIDLVQHPANKPTGLYGPPDTSTPQQTVCAATLFGGVRYGSITHSAARKTPSGLKN